MPNWVYNKVWFTSTRKKDLERLKKFMYKKNFFSNGEEDKFCFDKLIPYPHDLKMLDKLSRMRDARRIKEAKKRGYDDFYKCPSNIKAEIDHKFPQVIDGYNQKGYDWCINNWGTKWGACHTEISEIHKEGKEWCWNVTFDTAWNLPMPIYDKLTTKFPNVTMEVIYEEESREFKGRLVAKNGKILEHEDIPFDDEEEE